MKHPVTISDLLDPHSRFVRSVDLVRDFDNTEALAGYVPTPPIAEALRRILSGVESGSTHRAWRITGDYGSGKSSFMLLLASLLSPSGGAEVPASLLKRIKAAGLPIRRRGSLPRLLPVFVSGSRQTLASALVAGLTDAIKRARGGRRWAPALKRALQAAQANASDNGALQLIEALRDHVQARAVADGLLIVFDELGKLLEHAALQPDSVDIFLLQRLAELAARSGDHPLMFVGILHQGFRSYARLLTEEVQREWSKIAGRYEEVIFDHSVVHMATLIRGALCVKRSRLASKVAVAAQQAMRETVALGWYGQVTPAFVETMTDQASGIYPLHPAVLPVAKRFFARFAQQQRSVLSFLLSDEPCGLQTFAQRAPAPGTFYRLHDFYDYVRENFGYRLAGHDPGGHWTRILETIASTSAEKTDARRALKSVGLLNLMDSEDLAPTREALAAAIGPRTGKRAFNAVLRDLTRREILFDRGSRGGYCLWPPSSVSLARAKKAAARALAPIERVAPAILPLLDAQPLPARRHQLKTGTLRHLRVRFVLSDDLHSTDVLAPLGDGLLLTILCDSESERRKACGFVRCAAVKARPDVLVVISASLAGLRGSVQEVEHWRWIAENTAELEQDRYAAEEVTRQLTAARAVLNEGIERLVGLHSPDEAEGAYWYYKGRRIRFTSRRVLLAHISKMCDVTYTEAPRIVNELVNRRSLSSAAAMARRQLIERIHTTSDQPLLGMDLEKAPPAKAIYLSILNRGRIHCPDGDHHRIMEPEEGADPLNVRPVFSAIRGMLGGAGGDRVSVASVGDLLRSPPYGVRGGVIPILLAIYSAANAHELAFYEHGSFVPKLGLAELSRLVKSPGTFELQRCSVTGIRSEVLSRLAEALRIGRRDTSRDELLGTVTHLCVFAAGLPQYVRSAPDLTPTAKAVLEVLLHAREPVTLLFEQLPDVCGLQPFTLDGPVEPGLVESFVKVLVAAISDLQHAFGRLRERLGLCLANSFDLPGPIIDLRTPLGTRARRLSDVVREPRLRTLCLRLADDKADNDAWIDGVASFVCTRPPSRWAKNHEALFAEELPHLAEAFRHAESLIFDRSGHNGFAIRAVLTRADGTRADEVVRVAEADEPRVKEMGEKLEASLRKLPRRLRRAAASRLLWKALTEGETQS